MMAFYNKEKDMEGKKIDINQAAIDELVTIKGIGTQLAKRIVDGRPYENMNDLVRVSGINEVKLASLLPNLTLRKQPEKTSRVEKTSLTQRKQEEEPFTKTGDTEAFIFLENRNERQDAIMMILAGFIIGLIILFLRRSNK
jgi:Holliday junction resolvasome RuvABC DNA-binding subunit